MLTAFVLSVFLVLGFSLDYVFRLALSQRGDRRQETRTSMFIDVAGVGISLGFILGVFLCRLAGVEDDFARTIIAVVCAVLGFFAVGLIGDKRMARAFGVELQDIL